MLSFQIIQKSVLIIEYFGRQESYEFADITNRADWEIKDQLDEADRVLDDGVSKFIFIEYFCLVYSRGLRYSEFEFGTVRDKFCVQLSL